jgi:hypothetical protein
LPAPSLIFQSAKLGDRTCILSELEWAEQLLADGQPAGRIYGVSGGTLVALAFALEQAARAEPGRWGRASSAVADVRSFLRRAGHWQIHGLNLLPRYGFYNLRPLRRWLGARLHAYSGRADWRLSELPGPLYCLAMDFGGVFTLFGPPDETLQFDYFFRRTGPPRDAPAVDAVIAALSTLISTEPAPVNGAWYRDPRPALSDASALIADLEAGDPRPLVFRRPHTRLRPWPLNFVTSPFIMHSQNERNQALETAYDRDLRARHASCRLRVQ